MCHACRVPSLAYKYSIGNGGLCSIAGLSKLTSISRANGTVSLSSLSSGTLGVDVSSSERFHHVSEAVLVSAMFPTTPMSLEVLSAMNIRYFVGCQVLKTAGNAPGGRSAGDA